MFRKTLLIEKQFLEDSEIKYQIECLFKVKLIATYQIECLFKVKLIATYQIECLFKVKLIAAL